MQTPATPSTTSQNANTNPKPKLRTRALAVGHLRAFEAVAKHLNFRMASEELALTQSAVSRQIQALEDEVGVPLFLRHTRAVEITGAGSQLLRAVTPSLEHLDSAVRQIRRTAGRKIVSISTWASFSTMWLIPRLEAFQRDHPDIDIRIEATDSAINLDTSDVDLVLRYAKPNSVPKHATRLFGEQLSVVASPWLLKSTRPITTGADLAHFALIEADHDTRFRHNEWLTWQRWLDVQQLPHLEPKRWLYFNYSHQIVQAALTGQGVALCRMPLIADHLASKDLVELLPTTRLDTPLAYWLIVGQRSHHRPEIAAFCEWLLAQAAITKQTIGETLDAENQSAG
ncbi:MAG: LysR substrate-binding domain-containing protein [Burkholderiaceae bacterium]|nr:LysR substrate-binding domain-containing protein [Burkholderiaceae bacterium]